MHISIGHQCCNKLTAVKTGYLRFDFGWHRFRFAPCLIRKRVAKSEAILALLDTF